MPRRRDGNESRSTHARSWRRRLLERHDDRPAAAVALRALASLAVALRRRDTRVGPYGFIVAADLRVRRRLESRPQRPFLLQDPVAIGAPAAVSFELQPVRRNAQAAEDLGARR